MIAFEEWFEGEDGYRVFDGVQVNSTENGVPVRRVKMLDNRANLPSKRDKKLIVRRKDGLASIRFGQITSVRYSRHVLTICMADGRQLDTRVIQESFNSVIENAFSDPRFIRPHESYLVNMDYVAGITSKQFDMTDGAVIPISKRVYVEVKKKYLEYMADNHDAVLV